MDNPDEWHRWLGDSWRSASHYPAVTKKEIVAGEQVQDNPMHATQQFLMKTFDRAGAVEMESAGIAESLHSLHRSATYAPTYLTIRGVSDLVWAAGPDRPLTDNDLRKAEQFDKCESQIDAQDSGGRTSKEEERDLWTERAAAAASAFTLGLV